MRQLKKQSKNNNDFWIGFSDLMSGLMLVFIVLSLTFMAIAKQKIDEIDNKKKNIIVILSEKLALNNIKVEYNKEKGTVTISQDILFELNKPNLKEEGIEFIKLFSKTLDLNIFNNEEYIDLIKYVHIEGYASKEGSEDSNFILSFVRSKNVWYSMIQNEVSNKNIMKQKLNIVSRGEIDANQIKEDANDRKVVFRFEFYDTYNKIFEGLSK